LSKADKSIDRIIDANINRAKEGLRVCEEVFRFSIENGKLTSSLKRVRHSLTDILELPANRERFLLGRRSREDVGRNIKIDELKRDSIADIFFANIQRVKESLRVLEEFSKLTDKKVSGRLKQLRYRIYQIEKDALEFNLP